MILLNQSVWRANLRRAFCTPPLYAATGAVAILMLLEASALIHKSLDILTTFVFATTPSGGFTIVIYLIIPVIPFATHYAADHAAGAVPFWSVRCGIRRYARSQFSMAVFLGFCSVFFGFLLFILVLFIALPTAAYTDNGNMYGSFLDNGQLALYMLFNSMHAGLSGAVVAGFAAWFGTVTPNRLAILAAPNVCYMLLGRLSSVRGIPAWLRISTLIDGGVRVAPDSDLSWLWSFLCKLAVVLVICVPLCLAAEYNAKRRQKNA